MVYQCVRCRDTWGSGDPDPGNYSHGLCSKCLKEALTPLYRKHQVQEGNFDCFAKASGYCDQRACKYRRICVDD